MEDLQFKIQLKSGSDPMALAYVVAYAKCFTAHRFIWSTGMKVKRNKFNPTLPGKDLKAKIRLAEEALKSLLDDEHPVNNESLINRIKLIQTRISWTGQDLNFWNSANKKVERYAIPDSISHENIQKTIDNELQKQKPTVSKAIASVITTGTNELFGFWDSVVTGETKPRAGKTLRKSSLSVKRQSFRVVKEFSPTASFDKMDMRFYNAFVKWMTDQKVKKTNPDGSTEFVKRFDSNTIGKHIKELKSVLHLAYRNELLDNDRFKYWPVTKETNEVVSLSKEEVLKINSLEISGTKADVRDIFVMACFLGARISDFKQFKKESLETTSGITFFHYVQEKTGARVKIPVHPIALDILNKRNGEFPKMISEQNFRAYLKDISEAAELNDRVIIKIRDGQPQYKKKWEAISPHSARRTFASSLFYGWFGKPMPAALCMRYTGHKTEKSFLLYIGAKEKDLDAKALEYFDFQPVMKVS